MSVAHSCSSQNSAVPNVLKAKKNQWSSAAGLSASRCTNPWYNQATEASLLELGSFMALGGLRIPGSPNATGWPPLVGHRWLARMGLNFGQKKQPPSQIPNPTMRTSHVQCKKECFLKI